MVLTVLTTNMQSKFIPEGEELFYELPVYFFSQLFYTQILFSNTYHHHFESLFPQFTRDFRRPFAP